MNGYTIYGSELSYFTRKLEAAMIFYGAEFQTRRKLDPAIEARAGTHQIPVLNTPEDWMIADTTPLLGMLDGRFPERTLFPGGRLGVLVHVLEEYFDEWVARTMVHYRWHYPESAQFAAAKMSHGDPKIAERMLDWGPRSCRATGTESVQQQRAAEDEYGRILAAAERQLKETKFLLGDRPTAVDCVVLGGLRAHTYMDPVPKRVVADHPSVVAWLESEADAWDGRGQLATFPESTPFARTILDEMSPTYKPYVLGNRDAQSAGAKAFRADIYEEDVSYLSRPYPERSRQMVAARIASLNTDQRSDVQSWLGQYQLDDVFTV